MGTNRGNQGATASQEPDRVSDPQLALQLVDCVRLPGQTETTLVVRLDNPGANDALDVEAHVATTPFSEYLLESWRSPTRLVGRLCPGDKQSLEFTVIPKNTRDPYINVVIQVSFRNLQGEQSNRFELRIPLASDKGEQFQFQNPYIPGSPLDPRYSGNMYFGRRELIQSIFDNLVGKYQQNILVLHGQRRIGKTSTLLQLRFDRLKPPFYPVFLDMQGLADVGTYLFLHRITKAIAETLTEFGLPMEAPARQAILEGGYGAFDEFLDRVGSELHGGYLVLMLDEFEELEKRVQNHKLDRDIFFFLRSQMQHRRWMIFIFAGTHKLEELSKEYFNIFFNTALYHEVTFLTKNEAETLIRQPVAPAISYEDRAVNRILNATNNHPYFIQLICYHLMNVLNREARSQVSFSDVDDVIQSITQGEVGHLDYVWEQSTSHERWVLCGIAELQRTLPRVKHFPDVEILREIESMGERMALAEFSHAVETLIARDLVRHDQGSRACGITFELLSRWIREKHPRPIR